jgi:hypothetical protein
MSHTFPSRPALFSALLITLLLLLWFALSRPADAVLLPEGHPPITPRVGTTSADFFFPGSQIGDLTTPIEPADGQCFFCHARYNEGSDYPVEEEMWMAWSGSMMGQAGRDPVFWAALDVANADAGGAGEWCLRCHTPKAWLEGRATPGDGSGLEPQDFGGIECAVCHRMVDPWFSAENPPVDAAILAAIIPPLAHPGNGALILDPLDRRRGPFDILTNLGFDPHIGFADETLYSPYHKEALLCGSCHDITNPVFSWDAERGEYWPNELDTPTPDITEGFPIERTFSEWANSDYNSAEGVYAPQFGGNRTHVSTCQDCHMRAITGKGATQGQIRDTLALHDLTGANTWVPQLLPLHPVFGADFNDDYPNDLRRQALNAGVERARYMLQNAATVTADYQDNLLTVTITNESGHKLPTGYVEGRRMWLQIEGYNASGELIYTSGAWDGATGILQEDADLHLYESKQGLTPDWAAALGLPAGPSFHFALNNVIVSDNRIPPRGYSFEAFNAVQAAPVTDSQPDPDRYADGQHWDTATYTLPADVVAGIVRLVYQVAGKEYIDFLRDMTPYPDNPQNNGAILYDLWEQTDRSAPEPMAALIFGDGEPLALSLVSQNTSPPLPVPAAALITLFTALSLLMALLLTRTRVTRTRVTRTQGQLRS